VATFGQRQAKPLIYFASAVGALCAFFAPSLLPSARITFAPEPVFETRHGAVLDRIAS